MKISRRQIVSIAAGSTIAFLIYEVGENPGISPIPGGLEDPKAGYGINGFGMGEYGG